MTGRVQGGQEEQDGCREGRKDRMASTHFHVVTRQNPQTISADDPRKPSADDTPPPPNPMRSCST